MNNSTIQAFDFADHPVRTLIKADTPWFVAADVCGVLEISNPTNAIRSLDVDEVTLHTMKGSHRQTNLINESGLYSLVFRSRKPIAKKFRKWVTSEVLPAIRRTGRYETQPSSMAKDSTTDCLQAELLKVKPRWQQIQRYKNMGLNRLEISTLIGYSTRTVEREALQMQRCGLLPRGMDCSSTRALTAQEKDTILSLAADGLPTAFIAQHVRRSKTSVRTVVNAAGGRA